MRRSFRILMGALAASGILVATMPQAEAGQKASKKSSSRRRASTRVVRGSRSASGIEKSLLGIRILQDYNAVLNRFGQPTRIYSAAEVVDFADDLDAQGELTGGVVGFSDSAAPGGGRALAGAGGGGARMPQGMGGMMGMSGMGGGGGKMGAMMGGAMGGPPGMMMGGGMSGASGGPPPSMMAAMMRGGAMGGASGGGGLPGFAGGGMRMPGMPAGAGGGARMPGNIGGGGNAGSGAEAQGPQGYSWVYLFPGDKKAYVFQFNKDGRVEAIQERGRFRGMPTSRGISLGTPLNAVYQVYGWPDSAEDTARGISLFYTQKYHLQVDVLKNRVVALTVTLREDQRLDNVAPGGGGGMRAGAGRLAGMGGGMMGMPGMMGGGMSGMMGAGGARRPGGFGGALGGRKGGDD